MITAAIIGLMLGLITGCEIEETPPPATGSVAVSLADSGGSVISGARIRVDGRETPRYTPAVLTNLAVGWHIISAFKPGYADTSLSVEIRLNETSALNLVTIRAEGGSIELVHVPGGTTLILNNVPVDAVPVTLDDRLLFEHLGVGTFHATVYLPGHATELPAQWTIQLASGVPVPLTPLLVPVDTAAEVGSLAPPFELPCDWDSSIYRLQDYRGQVVLVTFFFANCTACIEEFPYIAAMYEDPAFSGKVQFLGVDFVDSYPTFARFRDEHSSLNITFPLLRDGRQLVRAAYGVSACPASFVVDATGRLQLVVHGAVSEPLLRQTLNQLLEQAGGPTFRFTMRDTLITYDNGNQGFVFHGRLENLLDARRTFVMALDSVSFSNPEYDVSICTYLSCYSSASCPLVLQETYFPLQIDTILSFDIYSSTEMIGDYVLRATIYPADNASERITHDLHLDDLRSSFLAARAGLRSRAPLSENPFRQ